MILHLMNILYILHCCCVMVQISMYGSARCEWILGLSRGKMLHIYICILVHHNTQCLSLGSLVFAYLGGMREKTRQLYMYMLWGYYPLHRGSLGTGLWQWTENKHYN